MERYDKLQQEMADQIIYYISESTKRDKKL